MNKIQRISKFFKWLFVLLFILLPIFYAFFWLHSPIPISSFIATSGLIPAGTQIMQPLSLETKMLSFTVALIPLSIDLLVLYFLIRLFICFERGEIFALENVKNIKRIGYTILIGQLFTIIYQLLITTVLTWNNPAPYRVAIFSFTGTNFGLLLAALLVILISWIMAEGYKLKEEQEYTI